MTLFLWFLIRKRGPWYFFFILEKGGPWHFLSLLNQGKKRVGQRHSFRFLLSPSMKIMNIPEKLTTYPLNTLFGLVYINWVWLICLRLYEGGGVANKDKKRILSQMVRLPSPTVQQPDRSTITRTTWSVYHLQPASNSTIQPSHVPFFGSKISLTLFSSPLPRFWCLSK